MALMARKQKRTPVSNLTIANLPERLDHLRKDPWKDYWSAKQRITRKLLMKLR